ncbi:ATP phosphoribosyltransferase regulatory subunit [Nitrincola nitratireducens]|uniref:ATP phosphoribosyltransferase regulatory subunit n=1 Tax=Nitrincola nitratireducens TaxID=1229521 RepID=W9V5E5_9GAMM|nr:ATP phosphoribosyltransferase regulatory subunit [Nitrincola nitratireducens]EXJ12156.1 ATP phosphoribosyltransferase regulatory subunit [Nitrincola nitratireducens]
MALADRWLLPEGIKELLPPEARQAELMRRRLLDLYNNWGYDLVMPPLVEHLESLLTGTGHDLDLNTFKLTDRLSGHSLGVRADITPQVARIDAHRLRTEGPSRLCYCGSVLHTHAANMLATRNPMQAGAELYGHAGIESDVEVISLMLETLNVAGISDPITLDLGHVALFNALIAKAKLSAEDKSQFIDLLQRKALTEYDAFLSELSLEASLRERLAVLPFLHGTVYVLEKAAGLFEGWSEESEAIQYLSDLAELIRNRFPQTRFYFDLAELRGYHYHTGVVFAAYTPSFGQALAKGGRYDEIGQDFGRARPATGFSTDLKTLLDVAGVKAKIEPSVLAPSVWSADLHEAIEQARRQGHRVIQALDESERPAGCDRQLVKINNEWVIQAL